MGHIVSCWPWIEPMDAKLREEIAKVVDELSPAASIRLLDDADRLWTRIGRLIGRGLVDPQVDAEALELACLALQLPMIKSLSPQVARLGQMNLRDRAEQSIEIMISLLGSLLPEAVLDRASRLLHELPQKSPMLDEARLLADAVNLDDFGLSGLLLATLAQSRAGQGLAQVIEGFQKRRQYGYWEARLKEGFHFEPVCQMARQRLVEAYKFIDNLQKELGEA
jgi:hypothetical protein